ncbi:MAG TPA: hypothetical protein VGL82_08490 [Bryobacteraceae bacterium]
MHSTKIFSLSSSVLFELSHYRSTYTLTDQGAVEPKVLPLV